MRSVLALAVALIAVAPLAPAPAQAQEPTRWQRRSAPAEVPVTVFHATHVANLPTAETLRRGEWLFEISHRFLPPVSDGADALWGFDGPVFNRLGLAYAATDRLMLGVLRSNMDDNLELDAKVRLFEAESPSAAIMIGAMGGVAWNTEPPQVREDIGTPVQAYGQIIVNAAIGERVAVGVVPTVLHNPRIEAQEADDVFALGLSAQLYLSEQASLLGEWLVSEENVNLAHDAATFGLELETGGHFFKVMVTNQPRMNPAQFLGGSPFPVALDQMRVAFNITRLLSF